MGFTNQRNMFFYLTIALLVAMEKSTKADIGDRKAINLQTDMGTLSISSIELCKILSNFQSCQDHSTTIGCQDGKVHNATECPEDLPRCMNGYCIKPSEFKCNKSGNFPDFTRCDLFYECTRNVAIEHKCKSGEKYNPKLKACSSDEKIPCYGFECHGKNDAIVEYTGDKNIVALCKDGVAIEESVCEDNVEPNDLFQYFCKFHCVKAGRFPVVGYPSKYYSCWPLKNGDLVKEIHSCPDKYHEFSKETNQCTVGRINS